MDRVSHTAFSRRERWFFGLLALFLMGSTALAVLRIGVDDANERLQARIDVAHELLTQRIANGSGSLASLAGLHQASHNLTPSELTSLAEQLLQRHQYFSHIAYVALVSHDERQEFEYEMHTSTSADYVIKAQASARGAPSPPKKTYLPITFVEPMTPYSARMLGLDLKPHKTIGRAINDAVRTGEEAAEPTEIFSGKPGLVLVQPTYYGTFRPNEAEERAAQLSGAFLLVIRWDKLLAQLDEAEHLSIGARRAPLQKREFSSLDVLRKKQLTATRVLHVDGARLTLSLEDDLHAGELNWQWASVAALVVGALCIAIVATLRHRKLARLEVERSKEMFFDLIDGSVQGIFIHRDGTMLFANQSFCDVLGYENPHELLKTPNIADHIAEQERQRLMEYRRSRSDGRAPTHYEFKALKRDGSEVLLENSVRVIDWHGAPAIQCTIADITERKAAENALIEVSERALSAARAKSEFLANISHELRTPLNGVCGMLQLLGSSDLETEQQDFVTVATTSSNTLLSLIDDILDFSRLESGRLELQYEPFDIRQWVHHVAAHLADAAQSKGVEFVTSVDIDVPEIIECDPKRLQQVLINLIGNASKFTEAGAIVLAVQVTETQTPDEVELVLSVSDTGIGIARDDQQKIFESFTQADGSTTRRFGGSGLGLAITSQLVDRMHGTLAVQSTPGKGSTFTATIPTRIVRRSQPLPPLLAGQRIACIDPNPELARVLKGYLEALGARVRCYDAFPEDPAALVSNRFVLIEGNILSKHRVVLREISRRRPVGVIRLSTLSDSNAKLAGLSDVIIASVTKPFSLADIVDACRFSNSAVLLEKSGDERRPNVLLIDGNRTRQIMNRSILEQCGYTVELASTEDDALACLAREPYQFAFVSYDESNNCFAELPSRVLAIQRGVKVVCVTDRDAPAQPTLTQSPDGVHTWLSEPLSTAAVANALTPANAA